MYKSTITCITNPSTGERRGLVVNALTKSNLRDIIIGCGIVMIGVAYIAITGFKNGAKAFDEAETKIFEELGLLE